MQEGKKNKIFPLDNKDFNDLKTSVVASFVVQTSGLLKYTYLASRSCTHAHSISVYSEPLSRHKSRTRCGLFHCYYVQDIKSQKTQPYLRVARKAKQRFAAQIVLSAFSWLVLFNGIGVKAE